MRPSNKPGVQAQRGARVGAGVPAPVESLTIDGPRRARCTLALAHGAGQASDSPFFAALTRELVARGRRSGGLEVARFDFPYMEDRRLGRRRPPDRLPVLTERFERVLAALRARSPTLVIGGKSLGGRVASLIADRAGVQGLVCLGYPFHPPGKPNVLRTAHLEGIATPTLICQGTRDPFGRPEEIERYALSSCIRLHWLEDGDHDLRPRKRSGRTRAESWAEAAQAVADFVASLL